MPSVTRVKNPKIIIAFNPDREEDIVYKEFISNTPPKNSVVRRVRWEDNPFFKDSTLYNIMLDDKERLPSEVFAHIWEGELAKNIEDSLFKKANFTPVDNIEEYEEIVIGVDPATTNTDFSNEYGIIVAAKTLKGECRILQDYTGKYTPREFTSKVVEAYYDFKATTIIVETNQGGDFIKSALLDIDTSLHIEEVRAGTSKHNRALPLANMMEIGTLRFVDNFHKLRRQMELTTLRGYLGPRGESPDALDAAIWAIYHLMGIKERDSLYQVFRPEFFDKCMEGSISSDSCIYATYSSGYFVYIEVKALTNGIDKQLCILQSKIENEPFYEFLNKYPVFIPDTPSNLTLITNLNNSFFFQKENTKLEDRVNGVLSFLRTQKVFCEKSNDNQIIKAFAQYTYDEDRKTDSLIDLFCDIIYSEFNI